MSTRINLEQLKVLEHVPLHPLIAFKNPDSFWMSVNSLEPVDSLQIFEATADKLRAVGFRHTSNLRELSITALCRRANLLPEEAEMLTKTLRDRGISLPEQGDYTAQEKQVLLRKRYADEISFIQEACTEGNPLASLYLAKLCGAGLVDGSEENYYRTAITNGSAQAENDLGALLFRSKSRDKQVLDQAEMYFQSASAKGILEAKINLEAIQQIKSELLPKGSIPPEQKVLLNSLEGAPTVQSKFSKKILTYLVILFVLALIPIPGVYVVKVEYLGEIRYSAGVPVMSHSRCQGALQIFKNQENSFMNTSTLACTNQVSDLVRWSYYRYFQGE